MRFKKDNVERVADTQAAIERLKKAGYQEVGAEETAAPAVIPGDAAGLDGLDTAQLRALAKEQKIAGYESMTKAALKTALKEVER